MYDFIMWGINAADRSVHVFMNILFIHMVVSSTCNPVNYSYHLILSSQPMISGELIFKNIEIKYEKGDRAGRFFKTDTTITTYRFLSFCR